MVDTTATSSRGIAPSPHGEAGAPEDEIEISVAMSAAGGQLVAAFIADPSAMSAERAAAKLAASVYQAMRQIDVNERR